MSVTESHVGPMLDEYLMADDRSRFLRQRMSEAPADLIRSLSARAARRFLARTLTLRELQELAHDVASARDTPEARALITVLAPTLPHCCVRNAQVVARAAVEDWLARVETTPPEGGRAVQNSA